MLGFDNSYFIVTTTIILDVNNKTKTLDKSGVLKKKERKKKRYLT